MIENLWNIKINEIKYGKTFIMIVFETKRKFPSVIKRMGNFYDSNEVHVAVENMLCIWGKETIEYMKFC